MYQRRLQSTSARAADAPHIDGGRIAASHRLLLWGWAFYLVGGLWYVFPSVNPQPADLVMATVIAGTALGVFGRLAPLLPLYWAIGLFLLVVANVNLFWWTIRQGGLLYYFEDGMSTGRMMAGRERVS